jgi:hypothetical protein
MACKFIFTVLFFLTLSQAQASGEESRLIGKWFYYKKIYGEIEMPEPPEATLRLYFEFSANGEERLYWWYEGQNVFCERKSVWEMRDSILYDRVTWVNPRNSNECGRDPDMQLGRETVSPLSFSDSGDLLLHMSLGDEPLIYVWKKISETKAAWRHQ